MVRQLLLYFILCFWWSIFFFASASLRDAGMQYPGFLLFPLSKEVPSRGVFFFFGLEILGTGMSVYPVISHPVSTNTATLGLDGIWFLFASQS